MTEIAAPDSQGPAAPAAPASSHYGVGGALGKTGFAWAVFEWARNPYYILVVIYIFAPYFSREIVGADILASGALDGMDPDTARKTANANGIAAVAAVTKWAGVIAALTAPFLGAALDRGGLRKPILAVFLSTIAAMSWLLWYAIPGEAGLPTSVIMVCLVVAYVCYTYSEVTHNSMLTVSGAPQALPMISGLGLGLGNLAGALLFLGLVMMFALPGMIGWPFPAPLFGIDLDAHEHIRLVGPICAIWLVVFSVPFFLNARDGGTPGASWPKAFKSGAIGVWTTIREAAKYKQVLKFLGARMLYADAMLALLSLGAVYVAQMLDWGFLEMTLYAVFASAWAFLGGLVGGWLDSSLGPKKALIVEITGMIAILAFQLSITPETLLFGLVDNFQVWDGLVFQSVSDLVYLSSISVLAVTATASISSSRSMLVTLAPEGRSGEFFGLYAIAGTVTAWVGPLFVEVFATWFNSQRIGMASISVLFIGSVIILGFVKMERAEA